MMLNRARSQIDRIRAFLDFLKSRIGGCLIEQTVHCEEEEVYIDDNAYEENGDEASKKQCRSRHFPAEIGQDALVPKSSLFDVASRSSLSSHSDLSFKNDKIALRISAIDDGTKLQEIYEIGTTGPSERSLKTGSFSGPGPTEKTDRSRPSEVACPLFPEIDYSQFDPSSANYVPLFPCSMIPT